MSGSLRLVLPGAVMLLIALALLLQPTAVWEGVDVAVVQRFAGDLGYAGSPPMLNVQGDLLLFVFTIGGAAAGFVLGYCWRSLFGDRPAASSERRQIEERDVPS